MSPRDWEEILTNEYWDYRWHQIMEPLCDTFQRWKAVSQVTPTLTRRLTQHTRTSA